MAVDENSSNLSLEAFMQKHYGQVHLTSVTIHGMQGEQTTEVQAPVPNTIMVVKPAKRVYQIRFYDGVTPKISKQELTSVLNSFTISPQTGQ